MLHPTNTDKRIIRTEDALKDAFFLLSNEKNIADISIKEITLKAEYSRSAFYKHYQNKEDFLKHMIQDESISFVQEIKKTLFISERKNRSSLEESAFNIFRRVFHNQTLYRLIFEDMLFSNSKSYFFQCVFETIYSDIQKPTAINYDGIEWELYVYSNTYWYFSAIEWWEKKNFVPSPENIARQCLLCKYYHLYK